MKIRRYTVTAHVKPALVTAGGQVIRTEAGVSCQGTAGESPQTVT